MRLVLAFLLPPMSAYLAAGASGAFWVNLLLTLLGYLPGVLHALWLNGRG